MTDTDTSLKRAHRVSTAGVTSGGAPMRVGTVALTVRDLDSVSRFYQEAIGLSVIEKSDDVLRLGVGNKVLLELRHDPEAAIASRQSAGLFHIAFLLPERADLARWLAHAAQAGTRLLGGSDHLVSEAIYLADPEGNGIEIYWDRPSETWEWSAGAVRMETLHLDLNALLRSAPQAPWQGLPSGTLVGHVHLQVGTLSAAETFYAGLLGLEIVCRYPGANFLSSGGYHHHMATNVWNSRGAPARQGRVTGLADVELIATASVFDSVRSRVEQGGSLASDPQRLVLADPWNTSITIVRG